jgi:hypothetical protein
MKTTETAPASRAAQGQLFPEPAVPLRFPCAYRGFQYAPPCRAKPGEPCHWGDNPWHRGEFHAERRRAAGEPLKTYEELYALGGGEAAIPVEEGGGESEDLEDDEAGA